MIFFYHGYDKLTRHSDDALAAFTGLGLPSYAFYIVGTLEVFGAILLVMGLLTRFTALLLAIEMGVALARVDLPRGGMYAVHNYELPLALVRRSIRAGHHRRGTALAGRRDVRARHQEPPESEERMSNVLGDMKTGSARNEGAAGLRLACRQVPGRCLGGGSGHDFDQRLRSDHVSLPGGCTGIRDRSCRRDRYQFTNALGPTDSGAAKSTSVFQSSCWTLDVRRMKPWQ